MNSPAGQRSQCRARLGAALAATLALGLGACGQKGPLYLPNAGKTPVTPPAGAASPVGVPPEATPLVVPSVPASGGDAGSSGPASGTPAQSSPSPAPSPPSQPTEPSAPGQAAPGSQSGPGTEAPATSVPAPAA